MAKQKKQSNTFDKNKNARAFALSILLRIEKENAYSNLLLDQEILRSPNKEERAFVSALVYGTLDYLPLFDEYIDRYSTLKSMETSIRMLLRMTLWQMYYSRIPQRAAVHEAVDLAKDLSSDQSAKFVNAILRTIARENERLEAKSLEAKTSMNQDILEMFSAIISEEEILSLAKAYYENRGICFRIREKEFIKNKDKLLEALNEEASVSENFEWIEHPFHRDAFYLKRIGSSIRNISLWEDGLITVQGSSAMLAAKILSPEKNNVIADFCAAPGGKSIHLHDIESSIQLLASDLHAHRVQVMQKEFERLGIHDAEFLTHDASTPWPRNDSFDKILLDVPCSALGLLATKPELRYRWKKNKQLRQLIATQSRLLLQAKNVLKPGGEILYSTCTLNPEENELQIKRFLEKHSDMELQSFEGRIEEQCPNLFTIDPNLREEAKRGFLTLWPHKHQTEGFFFALLRKKEE